MVPSPEFGTDRIRHQSPAPVRKIHPTARERPGTGKIGSGRSLTEIRLLQKKKQQHPIRFAGNFSATLHYAYLIEIRDRPDPILPVPDRSRAFG